MSGGLGMIENLKSFLESYDPFLACEQAVRDLKPGQSFAIGGVAGSLSAILVAHLQEKIARQILYVGSDRDAAERMRDDVLLAVNNNGSRYLDASRDHVPGQSGGTPETIESLRALSSGDVAVVVTPPHGLLLKLPAPGDVAGKPIVLTAGAAVSHSETLSALERLGFRRNEFVEERGDYAVRGGILDVFPFVGDNPLRAEFSGDEVQSLREFDLASQRSVKELSTAVLVPDLLHDAEDQHRSTILDYLAPDALIVLDEPERIFAEISSAEVPLPPGDLEALREILDMFPQVHVHTLSPGNRPAAQFESSPQPAFNGSISTLRRALDAQVEGGWRIFICCDSHSEQTRLQELLSTISSELTPEGEPPEQRTPLAESIEFSLEALHAGFAVPSLRLAVYTEHQIFNRLKRRGKKRTPRFKGIAQGDLHRLHKGDYVVHRDYGIGRFDGLKKITVRNVEQEVVKLLYEEKDTLYVNLNYINRLQKYSSKEGYVPKLTRLGSAEWDRLRMRAKKKVKDIARELIRLYAQRKQTQGFRFPQDAPWQKELEASFVYEDTFDQAKATLDVKQDMEVDAPMDRLICGDVGFGKTEVAVRAAFKAVLGGKQVAMLVPTTILAVQHYHTFMDRVSRYGVSVQTISRFKSKAEQTEILRHLKAGEIDIIIGTHRLLSKDVGFKNLGLLIIDEEHRFGVSAKERLRQIRAEVDTLTLTATPIPRTLHFSLLGARDLSIISTPPRNRLPVITEITQWNDDHIRDAVSRELHRGGQVYVVHDRVQTIEELCARIRLILPSVRLRYAHGQMPAHELEEVMMGFLEKKFDLLVSTKIIESGLDIPNVNTIIINRADRFGMAELYQLRGRVGRSNSQAYAYLLIPPISILPKTALLRLQAVEEFTELGSGFNLAMRDLEIRGAGNLLGGEQSGFIESMGFETYTRILDEAVHELKNEEFKSIFPGDIHREGEPETIVEVEFEALIPEDFVANDNERLSIYRRLYALTTPQQLHEIEEELADRFGPLPTQTRNLFAVVRLRLIAAKAGFKKVHLGNLRAHRGIST